MESPDYEKMHTRLLLSELSKYRAAVTMSGQQTVNDGLVADVIASVIVNPFQKEIDKIKAILATREHIPNKQEARAIRQLRAKERR